MTPQPAATTAEPTPQFLLRAAVVPGTTDLAVSGAQPGAAVTVLLGVREVRTPLPGGAVVDLAPDVVAGFGHADAHGNLAFRVGFPAGRAPGEPFLAQAVTAHQGPGGATTYTVSALRHLRVPVANEPADLYVLFGQSNAEGAADVAALPPALRGRLPGGRIWNAFTSAWQPVQAGVNNTTLAQPTRCGPELTLLDELAGTGPAVYLLKFAVGQTSLGPNPGPWNEWGPDAGELYGELLRRFDSAIAALRQDGLQPRLRGVCMMQGENDALSTAAAQAYGTRLTTLVTRLRTDLAQRAVGAGPELPFVLGLIDRLLPPAVFPGTPAVRDAQAAIADTIPACAAVETSGLPRQADRVHLDTTGVLALGRTFAAALRELGA